MYEKELGNKDLLDMENKVAEKIVQYLKKHKDRGFLEIVLSIFCCFNSLHRLGNLL